jgi:histidinol-phosphatase (PHP family)
MIDIHNHTSLCGHASGTPEEYIEQAIKKGIEIYGFSDHAPLPDHLREGVTMKSSEAEEYIKKIERVRDIYEDRISVMIGFEVDYPLHKSFSRDYFDDPRIDYIIGSIHYIKEQPVDYEEDLRIYKEKGIDQVYREYYETLVELAASGLVDILGHLDLIKKFGYRSSEDLSGYIKEIAYQAKKTDTAIEINTAGLRKPVNELYPSREILEILQKQGVQFTIGADAHSPEEVGSDLTIAAELLRSIGVKELVYFSKREKKVQPL